MSSKTLMAAKSKSFEKAGLALFSNQVPLKSFFKKIRSFIRWTPFILILSSLMKDATAEANWQVLRPGFEYQDLAGHSFTPWSHIHAFRINLHFNKMSLLMAKDLAVKHASVEDYGRYSKALLAVNGGFFDLNYRSLGLRITNKQQQSPFKHISWWGVFYIKNNQAFLADMKQFNHKQIDFAIQSGPRLLIDEHIPLLKPGRAERSALGITKDGQVIIVVTERMPLTTRALAEIMKKPPLNCVNALNLDGGRSSQLYASVGTFHLNSPGFSNVSDAIVVKSKK